MALGRALSRAAARHKRSAPRRARALPPPPVPRRAASNPPRARATQAYAQQVLGPGGQVPVGFGGAVQQAELLLGGVPRCTLSPPAPPPPPLAGCAAADDAGDCAALLALNASVLANGRALFPAALARTSVCGWPGVGCASAGTSGRRVVELDVHNLALAGSLPPQLAGLSEVRKLYLWANALTGACTRRPRQPAAANCDLF